MTALPVYSSVLQDQRRAECTLLRLDTTYTYTYNTTVDLQLSSICLYCALAALLTGRRLSVRCRALRLSTSALWRLVRPLERRSCVQCNSNPIYNQDMPTAVAAGVCSAGGQTCSLPLLLRFLYFMFPFLFSFICSRSPHYVQTTTQQLRCSCVHSGSACPAFAVCVSLCLTRSSVHKVAVHLSARRQGLIERQGRGHQGAGSSWRQAKQVVVPFRFSYPYRFPFSGVACFCAQSNTFLLCSVFCTVQFYMENTEPQPPPRPPSPPLISCLSSAVHSSNVVCVHTHMCLYVANSTTATLLPHHHPPPPPHTDL